jgi:hypothetical protein
VLIVSRTDVFVNIPDAEQNGALPTTRLIKEYATAPHA